jgi:hypothetical protein
VSHSHDNTLLQRLGFQDPDRRNPEHDKACVAIATRTQGFLAAIGVDLTCAQECRAALEVPIQKGSKGYQSTIGFVDALVTYMQAGGERINWWKNFANVDSWEGPRHHWSERACPTWEKDESIPFELGKCLCSRDRFPGPNEREWLPVRVLVEVKTSIVAIGDLLRQMNLYREYVQASRYVVFSLTRGDSQYSELLLDQGYELLTPGESR